MLENIKGSASLFFKIVVVMIMSFFLTISTSILCTAAFTEVAGYEVYGVKEGDEQSTLLYTHHNSDGEDLNQAKYEKEGYTITNKVAFRTNLKGTGKLVYYIGTQIIILIILFAFIYSQLWKAGNKDFQAVKIGKKTEDVLRGLKVGLMASAPHFILFLCLVFIPKFKTAIYIIANYHYFMINNSIIGDLKFANQIGVSQYLLLFLPFLFVPIAATVAYIIGYKDISISEKLVYKKTTTQKG